MLSCLYGAMFWVCDEHHVDNRGVSVVAEQCLHSAEAFSAFHSALPVERAGGAQAVGK